MVERASASVRLRSHPLVSETPFFSFSSCGRSGLLIFLLRQTSDAPKEMPLLTLRYAALPTHNVNYAGREIEMLAMAHRWDSSKAQFQSKPSLSPFSHRLRTAF